MQYGLKCHATFSTPECSRQPSSVGNRHTVAVTNLGLGLLVLTSLAEGSITPIRAIEITDVPTSHV